MYSVFPIAYVLLPTLLSAEAGKPPAADLADDIVLKALCPKHSTCRILDKTAAGRDARGNERTFAGVEVQAGKQGKPAPDDSEDDSGEPCLLAPYAILHTAGARLVSVEHIMTLREGSDCSYGARGGGESLTFDGKNVTFTMQGGSAWGWSETKTWEIAPRLRLVSEVSHGWWSLGSNTACITLDHRTGHTRHNWEVPYCAPDGTPESESDAIGGPGRYTYTEIPRVPAADPFAQHWATAAFPKPALVVTSQGGDGYVAFGKPGGKRDPRFRVIALSGRELIVDVADATLTTGAASWVNDDHLEVWAGAELPSYYNHCVVRAAGGAKTKADNIVVPAQQWGIRASDAAVFRGWGEPDSDPQVQRVEVKSPDWGAVLRFRIAFAKDPGSLTVAYSDSDKGKRQKRLTATSRILLKDPLSLGVIAAEPRGRE